MNHKIWIAWERQRRSIELAKATDSELIVIEYCGFFRYIKCLIKTFLIVKRKKPEILFIQNPSIILAFFSTCFLRLIFSIPVVVDRHSNFLLTPKKRFLLVEYLFNFLSYLTIRHADLTIVTNENLAHVIRVLGGKPFVLPDKIPLLVKGSKDYLKGGKKLLAISSFAEDEPIQELISAFSKEEMGSFSLYISGNSKKCKIHHKIPKNVFLTGFLSEDNFVELLFEVDAVIVLTKMEYTLLCGCYEAISAEKPLITSKTAVLEALFTGALFVKNDPDSISDGVQKLFLKFLEYKLNSLNMKKELNQKWNEKFETLSNILHTIIFERNNI